MDFQLTSLQLRRIVSGYNSVGHSESLQIMTPLTHQAVRQLPCCHIMCNRSLARRCHVEVHVGIETHGPPTKARLDVLRSAAARFTDDKSSVRVTHEPMSDRHCLVAQFTMRTTAQYKVVDDIAAGFKRAIWDFDDYMDMWITFPKRTAKTRSRGRKSPSDVTSGA